MSGFERQIDRLMELTAYQVERMKSMPDKFYLILDQPECTNVIFWYIPERLRDEKRDHFWQDELGKATAVIKVGKTRYSDATMQHGHSDYLSSFKWENGAEALGVLVRAVRILVAGLRAAEHSTHR